MKALNTTRYVRIESVCHICLSMHYGYFRTLRKKEHEQILINLCLALMGMYLVFILGANAAPVPVLCGISAALLQYFMLVFFSWTAVEAFCLYRKLVKIMGVGQIPVLKISLVVWCKLTINETQLPLLSLKSTHGGSILHVCQRGGWTLF